MVFRITQLFWCNYNNIFNLFNMFLTFVQKCSGYVIRFLYRVSTVWNYFFTHVKIWIVCVNMYYLFDRVFYFFYFLECVHVAITRVCMVNTFSQYTPTRPSWMKSEGICRLEVWGKFTKYQTDTCEFNVARI